MATEIRAGVNKPYAIFMKEAKEGLREKGRIELHGLGDSITNVIRAAEMLTNQGYADLVTFQTSSITSDRDGVSRTKAKVIIVLSKGSDFEKAFEDFEKSSLKLSTSTWKRDQFNLFDYECKSLEQSDFKINTSIQLLRTLDQCSIAETFSNFINTQGHLLSIHKEKNRFDILQDDFSSIGMWKVVKYPGNYELKEDDVIKLGRETLIVKKICGKFPGKNFIVDVSPSPSEKCCKICCSDENWAKNPLISLCKCSGSMKYTHYICLKNWLKLKVTCNSIGKVSTYMWNKFVCEVCKEALPDFFSYNGEVLPLVEIEYPSGPYVLLEDTKEGRQTLYVIDIDENQKVLIGRESTCEIRLNDISVSRVHSIITFKDNKFCLLDNKSKFGTLVKMCKKVSLGQGELANIQVGRTLIRMKVMKPWKCCNAKKVVPEE